MKNLFFVLVFILMGTVAFASNGKYIMNEKEINPIVMEINTLDETTISMVQDIELLKECHVKIKGTVNGKAVDIDVTFTSDSGSCVTDTINLLKKLADEK